VDVVGAILERVDGGGWPVGWVVVSCQPECEPDLLRLAEEIARDVPTCVLFTAQQARAGLLFAAQVFCLDGYDVIPVLRDLLLPVGLFRAYVVWIWDEVGPRNEQDPVHRAAYLFQQVRIMREVVAEQGVTIFVFTCSPRGGGRGFQSEMSLRLHLSQNHAGTVLTVDGRKAVPGLSPVLVKGARDAGV